MFSRLTTAVLHTFLASILLPLAALCTPLDDWDTLVLDGSKHKYEGQYNLAIPSFTKALSFAEKQKLPNKCVPISLCRLAEVELITNHVKEADSHLDRIVNLIKTQKEANTLNPQVSFWAAALSDAYEDNHKPDTRELCLKHACYLKNLVYGSNHRECIDCLTKLADYYIDENKIDKAIKTLEFIQALLTKQYGEDPNRFGNTLNDLAIRCENKHAFKQVEKLELEAVKIARRSKSTLSTGLPAFYCLLGINALDQGKSAGSVRYFQNASQQSFKINGTINKENAAKYLAPLPNIIWQINATNKLALAEKQYRNLLPIYKVISPAPNIQYELFFNLAKVLYMQDGITNTTKRHPEAIKYYKNCIEIAKHLNGDYRFYLPDLYAVLASSQLSLHKLDEATKSFEAALGAVVGKNEWRTASIYLLWGRQLRAMGEGHMAAQKLNIAYEQSVKLPPEKRGTVLADLLRLLAIDAKGYGNEKRAQLFAKQSIAEIKLQKKLKSKLGPDIFHRM